MCMMIASTATYELWGCCHYIVSGTDEMGLQAWGLVQMGGIYRPGAWHRWEGFTGLGPGTDGRALQAWGLAQMGGLYRPGAPSLHRLELLLCYLTSS